MYAKLISLGTVNPETAPATSCRDYGFSPIGTCIGGFTPWWIGAVCIAMGYSPEQ